MHTYMKTCILNSMPLSPPQDYKLTTISAKNIINSYICITNFGVLVPLIGPDKMVKGIQCMSNKEICSGVGRTWIIATLFSYMISFFFPALSFELYTPIHCWLVCVAHVVLIFVSGNNNG